MSSDKELKKDWQQMHQIVEQGKLNGYISEGDAKLIVPEKAKAGRLYCLVKAHKRVNPGSNIPPLSEVDSGSGSNTEFISENVDHHVKPEVQKLSSYL